VGVNQFDFVKNIVPPFSFCLPVELFCFISSSFGEFHQSPFGHSQDASSSDIFLSCGLPPHFMNPICFFLFTYPFLASIPNYLPFSAPTLRSLQNLFHRRDQSLFSFPNFVYFVGWCFVFFLCWSSRNSLPPPFQVPYLSAYAPSEKFSFPFSFVFGVGGVVFGGGCG